MEKMGIISPRLWEGTVGVLRELQAPLISCWRYGALPLYWKRPGQTAVGHGSFRACLLGGGAATTSHLLRRNFSCEELLQGEYRRASKLLETIVMGGEVVRLPRRIIRLVADVSDFALGTQTDRQRETGDFDFISQDQSLVHEDYIPLLSIGDGNNDSRPTIMGHGLLSSIYLVSGNTRRLYEQVVEDDDYWEFDDGTTPLICFYFGVHDLYEGGPEAPSHWMPTSLFFPRERGYDLQKCFPVAMRSDNCAGAFELALALMSLRLAGVEDLVQALSEPLTLTQIKVAAMPDITIIVDTYGGFPDIGAKINSGRVSAEFCHSLDNTSFIRDPIYFDELSLEEKENVKGMMNSHESTAPLGIGKKGVEEWVSVAPVMPEFLGESAVVDLMYQRTHGLSASVLTHDYPPARGRLPIRGLNGDLSFSEQAEETKFLFHSRCMDPVGSMISIEGARSFTSLSGRHIMGINEVTTPGLIMLCKVPRDFSIPGIVLSGALAHEVCVEMRDTCEMMGTILHQYEGLVKIGLPMSLNIVCNRVRRWVVPVKRPAKEKMSQILSRPTTRTVFFRACGLPLLYISDHEEERPDLEEMVAKANSMAIRAACMTTMQFEVKKFFKYFSGRKNIINSSRLAPLREMFGIPIEYITGTGVSRLMRRPGGEIYIESSEWIYVRHEDAQKKLLARIILASSYALEDFLMARIYGQGIPLVDVGKVILEFASFHTQIVKRSYGKRLISPYEGAIVRNGISPWVLAQEFRNASGIPQNLFGGIDSEGAETLEQLYSMQPNHKISVALPLNLANLQLDQPRDLVTTDPKIAFSREEILAGEAKAQTCLVIRQKLQGTMELSFENIFPAYSLSFSEVYAVDEIGDWKTGLQITSSVAKTLNVWAARKARRLGIKLIAKESRANGKSELKWSDSDGDNFFMTHPGMGACRANWGFLLEKLYPDAKEIVPKRVREWIDEPHPTLGQKSKVRDLDLFEPEFANTVGFRPELPDDLRRVVEEGKKKLDRLHVESEAQKARIEELLQNWDIEENEQELLRYGYERGDIQSVIGQVVPEGLKIHLAKTGEVTRECLDVESRALVARSSDQDLQTRELGGDFEIKAYWVSDRDGAGWKSMPLRQAQEILRKGQLSAFSFTIREKNSEGGGRSRYFEAETVHSFEKIPVFVGVGNSKESAKADACRKFIRARPNLEIPRARRQKLAFSILNGDDEVERLIAYNFIAFDCEMDPERPEEGATCVSLALGDTSILWVRGKKRRAPKWLKEIMENADVTKYGFHIDNDLKALRQLGIECVATKDLKGLRAQKGFGEIGLRELSNYLVGIVLEKGEITMSFRNGLTWSDLSEKQKFYAGADAIATMRLAELWEGKKGRFTIIRAAESKAFEKEIEEDVVRIPLNLITPFVDVERQSVLLPRGQIPDRIGKRCLFIGKGFETLAEIQDMAPFKGESKFPDSIVKAQGLAKIDFIVIAQRMVRNQVFSRARKTSKEPESDSS